MKNSFFEGNFYEYKGYTVFPRLNLEESYESIGNSKKKVQRSTLNCIYCGNLIKNEKVNYAHLIPELFGKNKTHNEYECNSCNKLSSKWETSLGTFTLPLRIIGKVKNKKGKIPKFKSRLDGFNESTIIYYDERGVLKVKLATLNDFDKDKGKLKFRVGSHNPYHVYKAFLKVALSLMQEEVLEKEKWMIDYLFNENIDDKIFPILYLIYMDTKIIKEPYFELLRYKGGLSNHPKFILLACFGKSMIQIILPLSKIKKKIVIHLPRFMEIIGTRKIYNVEKIDLENNLNERRDWIFDVSIKA